MAVLNPEASRGKQLEALVSQDKKWDNLRKALRAEALRLYVLLCYLSQVGPPVHAGGKRSQRREPARTQAGSEWARLCARSGGPGDEKRRWGTEALLACTREE